MIIQLSSLLDWVCSPDGTHNDKIGDREAASESLEKSIWTVGLLFQWVKPIMTKLPGFKTPSHLIDFSPFTTIEDWQNCNFALREVKTFMILPLVKMIICHHIPPFSNAQKSITSVQIAQAQS